MDNNELQKYHSQEYGCCPNCKHKDNPTCNIHFGTFDTCTSYRPCTLNIGIFQFDKNYYHSKYESINN